MIKIGKKLEAILPALMMILLMTVLVASALFPAPALAAEAPGIISGSGILTEDINSDSAATVYYGSNAYRSIGSDGTGVAGTAGAMTFLLSGTNGGRAFDRTGNSHDYASSNLRTAVDEMAEELTGKEKAAIIPRTLVSGSYAGVDTDCIAGPEVENAIMWPLSAKEAGAVADSIRVVNPEHPGWAISYWWTRSLGEENYVAIAVEGNGTVNPTWSVKYEYGVRPAFYLNMESVLFISAAEGGKPSGDTGAGELTAVGTNSGNEWKLTLLDDGTIEGLDGHGAFQIDSARITYDSSTCAVTVPYTGAAAGDDEYISAIIKDRDGNIKYYGRIAKASDAADASVTIDIGDKLGEEDTLWVFNEQYNGEKKTDYASDCKQVVIPWSPMNIHVDVGADHGSAAADLSAELARVLPEDTEISAADDQVNISLPGSWCRDKTNGDIIGLLEQALGGTRDFYGKDHNPVLIGYKDTYDTEAALIADLEGKGNDPLADDMSFYVLWDKLIETANVTVKDTPVCGFTVTGSDYGTQTPKPTYEVEGEGIDTDHSYCCWWSSSSVQEDEGRIFEGKVRYGDDIYVCAVLRAKFGYYFNQSNSSLRPATAGYVNGSKSKSFRSVVGQCMFTGTIPVTDHDWDKGKVTKEPTATAEGVKTYTCRFCDETKTETIPPKDVDPSSEEPVPEPPAPGSDPDQKGKDGTAVGPGASAAAADRAITSMKSDTDPKGSVFGKLQLRSPKQTKNSIKLNWTKVSKAKKYVIYGNKCGKANKPVKLMAVSGRTKTFKALKGKKIKKGTYYKFIVVALDKDNKVVSTSKLIHVATKGGKIGNHKKVTVRKSVLKKAKKMRKGKSLKLKAKAAARSKKLKVRIHVKVRYESTNTKIATVTKKGVVKARSKGTCYIYAYAQNGVAKKIRITVK